MAAAVERLHPAVRFVSEIGGEDMKTIFFSGEGDSRSKQVQMQSACSGGTGTFVEKTARKLDISPERLAGMGYRGYALHKLSSKCGIFAEADANTLLKAGVPNEEIIASLFEAVVIQNLSTLTRGIPPAGDPAARGAEPVLPGPARGLDAPPGEAVGRAQGVLPAGKRPEDVILVPEDALYYAALGCVELARAESGEAGVYAGTERLREWIERGQHEEKKKAAGAASPPPRTWTASARSSTGRPRRCRTTRSLRSSSGATSAPPPPRPSACRRKASSSVPATRSARATRSKTPGRCSGRCARRRPAPRCWPWA